MALTVTAGTPATATQYNALIPKYGAQASDVAMSTTPANPAAFTGITIAANETWVFEVFYAYGNFSVATNNMQTSWSSTGTVTGGKLFTSGAAAGSGSVTDTNVHVLARSFTTSTSFSGTTNATTSLGAGRQVFVVDGGASGGTITLAVVMSAGTGTFYTGSIYIAHRIS